MGLRFLLFFSFLLPIWGESTIKVSITDESGNFLKENTVLKIGQTILFRIESPHPESIENVVLETWNSGVSQYEGITNNLSSANTFDIPYIVPDSSIHPNLSFDVVVRSKAGGRQHFFINKPKDWKIKKNSFLESLVELDFRLIVEGLTIDHQSPLVGNVISKKKKDGTLVSFDVQDSSPDLTRMRVLDRPAKCYSLKGDSFRCECFIEKADSLVSKSKIEITALDRARNLKKIKVENIYNPTASIALRGLVVVESCKNNNLELKLSFVEPPLELRKLEFFDSQEQRALASESFVEKKAKVISTKIKDASLSITLKNLSKNTQLSSSFELLIKDKNLREFLYSLEDKKPSSGKSLMCEGKVLNPDLIQIKEIQE